MLLQSDFADDVALSMCFITGQFISAGVLRGFVSRLDEWGYKIPYALQWAWPIL